MKIIEVNSERDRPENNSERGRSNSNDHTQMSLHEEQENEAGPFDQIHEQMQLNEAQGSDREDRATFFEGRGERPLLEEMKEADDNFATLTN